jgi:hypothetical protein
VEDLVEVDVRLGEAIHLAERRGEVRPGTGGKPVVAVLAGQAEARLQVRSAAVDVAEQDPRAADRVPGHDHRRERGRVVTPHLDRLPTLLDGLGVVAGEHPEVSLRVARLDLLRAVWQLRGDVERTARRSFRLRIPADHDQAPREVRQRLCLVPRVVEAMPDVDRLRERGEADVVAGDERVFARVVGQQPRPVRRREVAGGAHRAGVLSSGFAV